MTKKNYEKDVNRFAYQLNAIISLKNIDKTEFYIDINKVKANQFTHKAFENKYNQLFDGTIAKFSDTTSFLGSYRRNINPKYFTQSNDVDVINFSKEFRFRTHTTTYKVKKIPHKQTKLIREKDKFEQTLVFNSLAENEIRKLKNVWNLSWIIKNNLIGYQEVNINVNYDLMDEYGNIVYPDLWITFSSGFTNQNIGKTLHELYLEAYNKFVEFLVLTEQSKLFVSIISVATKVYRLGY